MAIIFDILEEEKNRLLKLRDKYKIQISKLPKGSISRKKRWNREYIYLAYREDYKIKFDYIGPLNSEMAKKISEKVEERKELESKLRQVNKNLKEVERGLRGQQ